MGIVDLSAIAKKTEKKKTEYPPISSERAGQLAKLIIEQAEELSVLESNLEINKAELRSLAVPEFFAKFAGRTDVPSSMAAQTDDGREVLVTMSSRYKAPTSTDDLIAKLGEENAARFLKPVFKLSIDSEKIPQDKQQEIVNSLLTLLAAFECADALSASQSIVPTAEFHTARHTLFTPEVNMEIENIMPLVAMVKTKGRK